MNPGEKIPGAPVLLLDLKEGDRILCAKKYGTVGSYKNCRPGEVLVLWDDGFNTFLSYDTVEEIILISEGKNMKKNKYEPKNNLYYNNPALSNILKKEQEKRDKITGKLTLKQNLKRKIKEISDEAKLSDFRYSVFISMQDSSNFLWRNSFALSYHINNKEFILVFTEHYGNHYFCREDINHFAQYERTNIAPLKCAQ